MEPDDEVIFGRALDESRTRFEEIESLRMDITKVPAGGGRGSLSTDLTLAKAAFELHGATLRTLARWYPREPRVRTAAMEWELASLGIGRRLRRLT